MGREAIRAATRTSRQSSHSSDSHCVLCTLANSCAVLSAAGGSCIARSGRVLAAHRSARLPGDGASIADRRVPARPSNALFYCWLIRFELPLERISRSRRDESFSSTRPLADPIAPIPECVMRCVPYSFAAVCLLLSLLLPATMLLSVRARSQEFAPAQAPATESPKADSEQPPSSAAPAPAAPGAPSPAPPPASPGSVPVPQVVVKPTAPKPAAPVAGPRPAAAPPPPPAAAPPRRTALRTRRAAQPAPSAPPPQPQPLPTWSRNPPRRPSRR